MSEKIKLDRYLDETEISYLSGFSLQTLRNWRCKGMGLPYRKVGRSVRYLESEVIEFMERGKITPPISIPRLKA